jgi:hypothetical protein
MPKSLDLKTFEEKGDKDGLVWEEKGQFEKAIGAYDRLLLEAEAFSPAGQLRKNEKNAIIAYLFMRKARILLQTEKAEAGEQLIHRALEYAKQSR